MDDFAVKVESTINFRPVNRFGDNDTFELLNYSVRTTVENIEYNPYFMENNKLTEFGHQITTEVLCRALNSNIRVAETSGLIKGYKHLKQVVEQLEMLFVEQMDIEQEK